MKFNFFISLLAIGYCVANISTAQATEFQIDDYILAKLPDWSDLYNEYQRPDKMFLNIPKLMQELSISRNQAIDLQTATREARRKGSPVTPTSLPEAQNQVDTKVLRTAKFIVVFDLDETLYDQSLKKDNTCADISFETSTGKTKKILTAPRTQSIFTKIVSLGGVVVLFSANQDEVTQRNVSEWKFADGTRLLDSKLVTGVLSNSSLIVQSKDAGFMISNPSKDMRYFDEKLEKVIIIDDNPTRIFQPRNLRLVKKLDGDEFCEKPQLRPIYNAILANVEAEIEESVQYMTKNKMSFAKAFLPYSMIGQVTLNWLKQGSDMTTEQAIEFIRKNPDIVESFF